MGRVDGGGGDGLVREGGRGSRWDEDGRDALADGWCTSVIFASFVE